jgi:hypothetical protein
MSDAQHDRFSKAWWLEPERAHRLAAAVFFTLGLIKLLVGIDDGRGEMVFSGLLFLGGWFWFAKRANCYASKREATAVESTSA